MAGQRTLWPNSPALSSSRTKAITTLSMKLTKQLPLLIILTFLLQACTTIGPFSETAYKMATSLKVDSLALMDKATESYTTHQKEVEILKLDLSKAYEYAKGRPLNEDSTKQWAIMIDPDRNLVGGFMKRWAAEGTLGHGFIEEAKKEIGENFDRISELESGKNKTK